MASASIGRKFNAWFQQTMIRIKDPKISVPWYEKNFGMRLAHKYDLPEFKFSVYFLESYKPGDDEPSEKRLWDKTCTIELTHNYGTENQEDFKVNNGNVEPHRGFGHIAFNVPDVYAATDDLVANNVEFKKKPDEGRMKGIAFCYDPDGYWIELCQRHADTPKDWPQYNLSQTMLRVKDAEKSLAFYRDVMGMTVVKERHFGPGSGDFSLYFLAHGVDTLPADPNKLWQPCLELTHNHGTEKEEGPQYHNGNDDPQGFGHVGFVVDDLDKICGEMEGAKVPFKKRPSEGKMRGLAFAFDPDGYSVELIQRGLTLPQ